MSFATGIGWNGEPFQQIGGFCGRSACRTARACRQRRVGRVRAPWPGGVSTALPSSFCFGELGAVDAHDQRGAVGDERAPGWSRIRPRVAGRDDLADAVVGGLLGVDVGRDDLQEEQPADQGEQQRARAGRRAPRGAGTTARSQVRAPDVVGRTAVARGLHPWTTGRRGQVPGGDAGHRAHPGYPRVGPVRATVSSRPATRTAAEAGRPGATAQPRRARRRAPGSRRTPPA